MDILMVIKRFKPDILFGGAERAAFRLTLALTDCGLTIDVASARLESGWPKKEHIPYKGKMIKVNRFFHPPVRFLGTLLYNTRLFLHILANRNRYNVIHVHFASFEMITAVIAKYLGGPPVLCKIACSGETGEISMVRKQFFAPLLINLMKRVNTFVALSPEIINELIDCGVDHQRIKIIPNGVDTRYFTPPAEQDRNRIRGDFGISNTETALLFAGRLSKQKGLVTLLRAIHRLNDDSVILLIAGQGPEDEKLKSLTRELGIERRVRFLGPVEDIRSIYQASDIFVLPSYYEGLSNSLLEAMSTGLKVVATRVSGSRDIIENGETGILAEPGNSLSIASAISASLLKKDDMGKRARNTIVELYSAGKVADKYIEAYREIKHISGNGC